MTAYKKFSANVSAAHQEHSGRVNEAHRLLLVALTKISNVAGKYVHIPTDDYRAKAARDLYAFELEDSEKQLRRDLAAAEKELRKHRSRDALSR